MATKRRGGGLGDGKGGDLLESLRSKLAAPKPPALTVQPRPRTAMPQDLAAAMKRRSRPAPPPTAQAREAISKAKPRQEVIKLSRDQIAAAIRQAQGSVSNYGPAARAPTPKYDYRESAYRRIVKLRAALEGFVADNRAPTTVGDATRSVIDRRITLGAVVNRSIVDPDADGYIGHDFGTSATKAVVRWPYDRAQGAAAINLPQGWCSGGIPHLWPTLVYLDPATRHFSPLPDDGLMALSGFKSALIEGRGHRMCCGSSATMADAAVAFLTMHLAYVLGTITEDRPNAKVSAVNIGVPVAALAEKKICASFGAVARAAILLLDRATSLTLDDVVAARTRSEARGLLPFELHTELSGAIAGYHSGQRSHRGPHMIIDCGSATLDIASFRLGEGQRPIEILAAGVEPLGADACLAYTRAGASVEDCRQAAYHHEHLMYGETLGHDRQAFQQETDRRYPYQVILVGGGVHGAVHAPLLDRMERAFQRPFHRPVLDRDLACAADAHPGRLILADGLARSPVDLREVVMPRDKIRSFPTDVTEMISKDQV